MDETTTAPTTPHKSKFGIIVAIGVVAVLVAGGVSIFNAMNVPKLDASAPYATYRALQHHATACDAFKIAKGAWPKSLEELRKFRPILDEQAKSRDITLVPFDEGKGYGALVSKGGGRLPGGTNVEPAIEIRFPIEGNVAWNKKQSEAIKPFLVGQ